MTEPTARAIPWKSSQTRFAVCRECDLCAYPHAGRFPEAAIARRGDHVYRRGPGWHEDQQGLPFVGASGKFLDELLGIAGSEARRRLHHQRRQVPPAGQSRSAAGRDCRLQWLPRSADRRHRAGDGRHAGSIFDGAWFPGRQDLEDPRSAEAFGSFTVVPMYHPAAALARTGGSRMQIEADFAKLPAILDKARRDRERSAAGERAASPDLDQMKLF